MFPAPKAVVGVASSTKTTKTSKILEAPIPVVLAMVKELWRYFEDLSTTPLQVRQIKNQPDQALKLILYVG